MKFENFAGRICGGFLGGKLSCQFSPRENRLGGLKICHRSFTTLFTQKFTRSKDISHLVPSLGAISRNISLTFGLQCQMLATGLFDAKMSKVLLKVLKPIFGTLFLSSSQSVFQSAVGRALDVFREGGLSPKLPLPKFNVPHPWEEFITSHLSQL